MLTALAAVITPLAAHATPPALTEPASTVLRVVRFADQAATMSGLDSTAARRGLHV